MRATPIVKRPKSISEIVDGSGTETGNFAIKDSLPPFAKPMLCIPMVISSLLKASIISSKV